MPNSRKKIVILSAFYEPFMSGAEQMVKQILENLGDSYDMVLITARMNKKLPKYEDRPTFKIIRLGIGIPIIDKLLYPFLAATKTSSLKPDIAHAIMESYAGGALVILKYIDPKIKRILTLQSGDLDDSRKQKQFFVKLFFKTIHLSPHKITAISNFLAQRAIRFGFSKENVSITPNGVNMSEIPQNIKKENDRVICVARLSWEKGLNHLIKAWSEVKKNIPGAKLFLVGDGDKKTELEKLIKQLDISSSVFLLGRLGHKEVLEEISRSEVFICPSLAEGLGNVFIEAQACGVPPIGTKVGGIPDVIQDGVNGLLIEPKNTEVISLALIKLLKDKELNLKLSTSAKLTAQKFSWTNIMKQIEEIYITI